MNSIKLAGSLRAVADKNLTKMVSKIKLYILGLQILLPFALYLTLKGGNRPVEVVIGCLFTLSMLVLILIG